MRMNRFHSRTTRSLFFLTLLTALVAGSSGPLAQELTPDMLEAAARQSGLSKEELMRRYQAGEGLPDSLSSQQGQPGRQSLDNVDDSRSAAPDSALGPGVVLPFSRLLEEERLQALEASLEPETVQGDSVGYFGAEFFQLDGGLFRPPSFGPVPADYRLGLGDEVVVNVWGAIEFQETRIVDRDGGIILPGGGKIMCAGRRLSEVDQAVRRSLSRSHSTIDTGEGGDTHVEVTLGRLRAIRVFVVGAVRRPGSYELSSVSRMLTALYASGGPTVDGSFRSIQLVRGGEVVALFDLYDYLLAGNRSGDEQLREGDTILVPDVGPSVRILGEVKRPLFYEMRPGEGLADLLRYSGGFTARAATEVVHIERILPPQERRPGEADGALLDVKLDPGTGLPLQGPFTLHDGDQVTVDAITQSMDNFVEIKGRIKRPGKYELLPGMTVGELVAQAGGLWPDALLETAVIDRTSPLGDFSAVNVPLRAILAGEVTDVALQGKDVLEVFARWETQERPMVYIDGEVHQPVRVPWREGLTLRDLILKAGGLKSHADRLHAEVARLLDSAVTSRDRSVRPEQTVEVSQVLLGPDFLTRSDSPALQPWDRVYIRKLPWWEKQRTVQVRGEVFYPGVFSLERQDERLSSVIDRAGGIKPDAYLVGARIVRQQDDVGNVALDLQQALSVPGSEQDIILQDGDQIVIPDQMFTVKVLGEVGFPTSLVFQHGLDIDDYVGMAGGYLEEADKDKTRVVWPNGMSLPNKGGSKVVAGSTIIVPVQPPPEGRDTWETIRDISSIVASLATVWLIVDK